MLNVWYTCALHAYYMLFACVHVLHVLEVWYACALTCVLTFIYISYYVTFLNTMSYNSAGPINPHIPTIQLLFLHSVVTPTVQLHYHNACLIIVDACLIIADVGCLSPVRRLPDMQLPRRHLSQLAEPCRREWFCGLYPTKCPIEWQERRSYSNCL